MSTTKIRLWLVKETDLARQYCKFNPFVSVSGIEHGNSMEDTDLIWIPKSIIEHTSKRGNEHVVTLPDWFIEKEHL